MPYFITSDGCKVYYKTYDFSSSKPTMVFLNGTAQTAIYWEAHRKIFIDHFRLLLYDARAQGRSDLGQQSLSLESHTADLAALLDHLAVGEANLVGLSHGAHVALAFAARNRQRVKRLILCSLGAKPSKQSRVVVRCWLETLRLGGLEAMAWAALPTVFAEKYLVRNKGILSEIVKAIAARNQKEALTAHLKALRQYPPAVRLVKEHSPPALVISGSKDPLVSRKSARALAEKIHAFHKEVSDAGHSVPQEAPRLFNDIVLEFLLN
ncbi:MAG: alpha/beta hydrolase [Desulfobacterales bacterium]|jgi:3-oxoadipate enol-lactonase